MAGFCFLCPFFGTGVLAVVGSCLLVLVGGLSFVLFYGYRRQLMAGVCSVLYIEVQGTMHSHWAVAIDQVGPVGLSRWHHTD